MRLRFAEPVRFRFLVGMLSGSGSSGMELLLGGLRFVNAFTETCPDLQTKFYVQAELKQAGFKPAAILKVSERVTWTRDVFGDDKKRARFAPIVEMTPVSFYIFVIVRLLYFSTYIFVLYFHTYMF